MVKIKILAKTLFRSQTFYHFKSKCTIESANRGPWGSSNLLDFHICDSPYQNMNFKKNLKYVAICAQKISLIEICLFYRPGYYRPEFKIFNNSLFTIARCMKFGMKVVFHNVF